MATGTGDVISYCVCSLFYMIVLSLYFLKNKHLPILRTKLFKFLYVCGMLSLFLDTITGIMTWDPMRYPIAALYITQFLFLGVTNLTPLFFWLYVMATIGKFTKTRTWKKSYYYLPYGILLVFLVMSFFGTNGVFYIDPVTHVYTNGATHVAIYVVSIFYIAIAAGIGIFSRRVNISTRIAYASLAITTCLAMLIQFACTIMGRHIMLNSSAAAISICIVYFSLEMPEYFIDKKAGTFNDKGCYLYIQEQYDSNVRVSLLFIRMNDYQEISDQYSESIANGFLKLLCKSIELKFKGEPVFHNRAGTFVVVIKHFTISDKHLHDYYEAFNNDLIYKGIRIQPSVRLAFVKHNPYSPTNDALREIADNVYKYLGATKFDSGSNIFIPNEQFYKDISKQKRIEQVLNDAVKDNTIEVRYQPIVASDEHIVRSLEALARLKDPVTNEYISPDIFIRMAEINGLINVLGEQIYRKVIKFVASGKLQKYGVRHVSVNISMKQCQDPHLAKKFADIAKTYRVNPDFIIFEITETENMNSIDVVRSTIESFVKQGFRFALDDFGSGYANFAYILNLPVTTVKIDKTIFYSALENEKNSNVFMTIVNLVKNLNLSSIVEGVENAEQASFLNNLGLYRHQGFLYSKALPPDELIKFLDDFNRDDSNSKKSSKKAAKAVDTPLN